ncbi:MAG: hypothetical protein AAF321_01540 [Pseudomonadota bacterium]
MRAAILLLCGWLSAGPALAQDALAQDALAQDALAQNALAQDDGCAGARTSGTVAAVGPGLTLALADGTQLKLADVTLAAWPRGLREADAIVSEALDPLVGRPIAYRTSGAADAFERRSAQVWTAVDGGLNANVWLQDAMVAEGLVRVAPERARSCAARLLTREAAARADGRGIWREDGVRDAHAPDALRNATGTYQLVAGRLASVARTRRGTYLNFGDVWRFDTTAFITPALADRMAQALTAQALSGAGTDAGDAAEPPVDGLEALEGQRVLVRGWIERKNGPLIRIRSALQLRRIDE